MTRDRIVIRLWDPNPIPLQLQQYEDEGRILEFVIYDKEQLFNLQGRTAYFVALKPDGKTIVNSCNVTNPASGTAEYVVTAQTVVAAGEMLAQIQIREGDKVLLTRALDVRVMPSVNWSGPVESMDEATILRDTIAEALKAIQEARAAAAAAQDAETFCGRPLSDFVLNANYNGGVVLSKLKSVHGAGSGLDADLLDGKQASAFATAAQGAKADAALPKTDGCVPDNAKQLPVGANLNDYKTPGFFYANTVDLAKTIVNGPTASGFALVVLRGLGYVQIVLRYDEPSSPIVRAFYNGAWSTWTYTASVLWGTSAPSALSLGQIFVKY